MDTRRYNDQIRYNEAGLTVRSVLSSKNSILHKRMYDVAIERLLASLGISESSCTVKEVPAKSFLEPSSVVVALSDFPFITKTYSLESFWPECIVSHKPVTLMSSGFSDAASEIIYKDFVRGNVDVQNKLTSDVVTIPIEAVPDGLGLSSTIDLDNLSFSSKMNNGLE